jgi:hypothetical protein
MSVRFPVLDVLVLDQGAVEVPDPAVERNPGQGVGEPAVEENRPARSLVGRVVQLIASPGEQSFGMATRDGDRVGSVRWNRCPRRMRDRE